MSRRSREYYGRPAFERRDDGEGTTEPFEYEGNPQRAQREPAYASSDRRVRVRKPGPQDRGAVYTDIEGERHKEESDRVPETAYSALGVRTISSIVYVVAWVAALFLGTIPTGLLVAALAGLCATEFFHMMGQSGRMPNFIIGVAGAALAPLVALLPLRFTQFGIFAIIMSIALWYVFTPRANIMDVAVTLFGIVYTGFLYSSVVSIRQVDPGASGALLTLGVIGSVWANDALAYLVGMKFGKHKMIPKISPKKSWEGFAGGLAGSVLVWLILAILNVEGVGFAMVLPAALLTGLSGVLGDLFESRIKRGVGVKDSGDFMPGHGGMLDRSDSLLFASLAAFAVLKIWGIL